MLVHCPHTHAHTSHRHTLHTLCKISWLRKCRPADAARVMVVPSGAPACQDMVPAVLSLGIPTIDMSAPTGRAELSRQMVLAFAERGFFKAVNHGVPPRVAARLDAATAAFFAQPAPEKQLAGPPDPLGYGSRSIGSHGDVGELEYLILHADPEAVAHKAKTIHRKDPSRFSEVLNEYVDAVRHLACRILDLLGEGLGLRDPTSFSRLITASDSDSLIRINHYPPSAGDGGGVAKGASSVGFGEHSDPQILSVLRANDVDGLQVLLPDGRGEDAWVQVTADPAAFFINVGDLLQALTNGRVVSIRHRVMASTSKPRLSTIYFAAPALHARISALPETVTAATPRLYRPFTWEEYKKTMYTLRLSHNRLDLFNVVADGANGDVGEGDDQE